MLVEIAEELQQLSNLVRHGGIPREGKGGGLIGQ